MQPSKNLKKAPSPQLTIEQIALILDKIREVEESETGAGDVVITIQNRHVRCIAAASRLYFPKPEDDSAPS